MSNYVPVDEQGRRVGEHHPRAHWPDAVIDKMRAMHEDQGMSYPKIGIALGGISVNTVKKVCRYQRRARIAVRLKRV